MYQLLEFVKGLKARVGCLPGTVGVCYYAEQRVMGSEGPKPVGELEYRQSEMGGCLSNKGYLIISL